MQYFKVAKMPSEADRRGYQWHMHPEGQMYLLQKGLMVIEIDGTRTIIPPGRIGWIPSMLEHRVIQFQPQPLQEQIIGLNLYIHHSLCDSLPNKPIVIPQTVLIKELLYKISSLENADDEARVMRLMCVLVDEFNAQQGDPLLLKMPQDKRLLKMATQILDEPEKNVRLEEWAKYIGYSPRSISRRFLQETGITVAQWRQVVKLEKALHMLGQGFSVTDVAFGVGYDSVSSFIQMFKTYLKTTPTQLYKKCCDI